jgi:hypothetical protein
MGKKAARKAISSFRQHKEDEKKLREKTQFQKSLALERYIPRKYEGPKSSLFLNFEGNRSVSHDVNDDAWILRVVTPSSARID